MPDARSEPGLKYTAPRCRWALTLGVALLAGYFAVAWFPSPAKLLSDHGHGYELAGATEILAGRHPFIDFQDIVYGPLMYYAAAAAQWITGGRPGGELLLAGSALTLGYALFFRLMLACAIPAGVALAATVTAIIVQPASYRHYQVLLPMIFFAAAWWYLATPGKVRLAAMALAATGAGLFRSDLGVIVYVAGLVTIMMGEGERRAKLRRGFAFTGAVIAWATPWLAWLAMQGELASYLTNASIAALPSFAGLYRPPPPFDLADGWMTVQNAKAFLFRLPLLMLVFAGVMLARWRAHLDGVLRGRLAGILAFAVLTQFTSSNIIDWMHVRDALPIRIFLFAWIAGFAVRPHAGLPPMTGFGRALPLGVTAAVGLSLVIGAAAKETPAQALPGAVWAKARAYQASRDELLASVRGSGLNFRAELYEYIRDHSAPDEAVFAVIEAPQTNYFANRRLPGPQLAIFPGYFSSVADQRRLIADIRRSRTAFVILDHLAQPEYPDFSLPTFAPEFWAFLQAEFVEVAQIGYCRVLTPRSRVEAPR